MYFSILQYKSLNTFDFNCAFMKKVVITIALVFLLIACGGKTTGKRLAPQNLVSGAVTADAPAAPVQVENSETAAEALQDLKSTTKSTSATQSTGAKSGTFYPPVKVSGTGKDALKEKTRALMSGSAGVPSAVDADKDFGPRYFSSDGSPDNLPGDYGKDEAPE